MTRRWIQWHLVLAGRRITLLICLAGFVAASLVAIRGLKLSEDFTDVLPMSAPAIAEQVAALRHLRQADRLYIDVGLRESDDAMLAQASARMSAALGGIPHLSDLRVEIDAAGLGAAYQELQRAVASLLSGPDLSALEPRLTAAALEQRLAWLKRAMTQPQGMMLKNLVLTDPVGLSDAIGERLRAIQVGVGDARIVNGRITSANGRHVLLHAAPDFPSTDTARSAELMEAVLNSARAVEREFPAGAVHIAVTGAHRSSLDNTEMIRRDTTRTSLLATVAIVALIVVSCRRRALAVLALAPVAFGFLGAMGVFAFTGDVVSAVALGCGSMLIGVTVDYGIYIIYTLDDRPPGDRAGLAARVGRLAPALMFGAFTTMAAFLVMLASPIAGHRQLGVFGLVGVGLAMGFAIVLLPVFIPVASTGDERPLPLTALVRGLFEWRRRKAPLVMSLVLLLTLVCGFGLTRVGFDGDLGRLNGITPDTRRDEAAVHETWGQALSLTSIVVGGTNRNEALRKNERVFATLDRLRGDGIFESFSSVAPLLPSDQAREANRRAWMGFWNPDRLETLRRALSDAGASLGFREGAFAPFLERLSAPPEASIPDADSALNKLTEDFWSERDGEVYVVTLAKVPEVEGFRRLRAAVRAAVPDAMLLNKRVLTDDITQVAREALPVFGLMVTGLNALLIYLVLGRISLTVVTMLPMAAGIFWTLGSLGLMGQPVDVANFIFVIFVVGVGGDYSLFLVMSELDSLRGLPERTTTTGGAVTMCAFTSLIGTGVLILADHPALFSVGLTALLGISFSLLATLVLVPVATSRLARAQAEALRVEPHPSSAGRRRAVSRFYRFQGPYISRFAYWKLRTDPLFEAVEQVVPVTGHILDLGCGYGLLANWLTVGQPGRRVHGLDFDEEKVCAAQAASRVNPSVTVEWADLIQCGGFPECDCALLCDVLHYFPCEFKKELLRKVFVALRPGGTLVLRDAMARGDAGHRMVARMEVWAVRLGQNRTRHGLHFEDEETHLALLREAGFERIETRRGAGWGSNGLLIAHKADSLDSSSSEM